ncbi:MAG: hypothetical protein K6E96_08645 [Bacteroidales bacterium]|jgi:membrane protein implicated in regulation of membrane protease activity|nr:hypothetical protein [Bacteroidales bacterium]
MKNLGWYLFFALLLGDLVAIAMLKLGVKLSVVVIIAGLVAAILALVLFFAGNARERSRKREQQTAAKLAELQEQVDGSPKTDEPAK